MRLTDRKTLFTDRIPLLTIRSIPTDRHMPYTDRYGAGVLDDIAVIIIIKKKVALHLRHFYMELKLHKKKDNDTRRQYLHFIDYRF